MALLHQVKNSFSDKFAAVDISFFKPITCEYVSTSFPIAMLYLLSMLSTTLLIKTVLHTLVFYSHEKIYFWDILVVS